MVLRNLVILAGGAGTRMAGAGGDLPKHLLQVGAAPLLLSAVDQFVAELGIERVVYRVAFQADRFVDAWMRGDYRLSVPSNVLVGDLANGPIGAVVDSTELLGGQTILFSGGDVYYLISTFRSMLAYHRSHGAPITVGVARSVPSRRPSTLVPDGDGVLLEYERKELTDAGDLINASLYLVESGRIDWLAADWRQAAARHSGREYKEENLWRLIRGRPDRARLFVLPGTIVNVNSAAELHEARLLAEQRDLHPT
jgi:D-glycero-alpha-D-manno-heptose 1-phosphate guanylyltransferase